MDKAVDEIIPIPASFQTDLLAGKRTDGATASMMAFCVRGDATKATREKGERFLEAAIEGVIELVRELKGAEIRPRQDHH